MVMGCSFGVNDVGCQGRCARYRCTNHSPVRGTRRLLLSLDDVGHVLEQR